MPDLILGISVRSATRRWLRPFRRLLRRFMSREKQKYEFMVTGSPVSPLPSAWSCASPLGISEAQFALLRYQFQAPDKLEGLGTLLGNALFRDPLVANLFTESFTRARNENCRLRVLISHEPEDSVDLPPLPWECIYWHLRGGQKGYFGLDANLGLARFLPKPDASPIRVSKPLTVLVAASDPHRDLPPIDVMRELELMKDVAARRPGDIDFIPLPNATWAGFKTALLTAKPHILIFAGHCGTSGGKPHLAFEAAGSAAEYVPVSRLASELQPLLGSTLGLVVLSACQSAVATAQDLYGNAARILIDVGVPAVVAMQSKVLDSALREFDLQLVSYLLQQQTIDAAMNAGRMAILDAERSSPKSRGSQWPIPVLYLSSRTDHLFVLSKASADSAQQRARIETRFPRLEPDFVEREGLRTRLEAGFSQEGVTLLKGPFGSGRTQLVTRLCLTNLHSPTLDSGCEEPFFFYVSIGERFKTLEGVVKELNRQSHEYGFQGFLDLLKREGLDDWSLAASLIEVLAAFRCVVVFDDFDQGYTFESPLFECLQTHLRTSKVYFVTSSPDLITAAPGCETIHVEGFEPEEVKAFFEPVTEMNGEIPAKLMEAAADFGNLPWFLRLLLRSQGRSPMVEKAETLPGDVESKVTEEQRKVVTQLAILRRPVSLQAIAGMLDLADHEPYLKAALELQDQGILSLAPYLEVELPLPLREHFYSTMGPEERLLRHFGAASFFERRARAQGSTYAPR